jgi:hypothetical protein
MWGSLAILLSAPLQSARGQDQYSVEQIESAPSGDSFPEEWLKVVSSQGQRVKSGARTLCEIWLAKDLEFEPEFKATEQRLYGLQPGQWVGLIRFGRKGNDFRNQTIPTGWYSVRFGLQPIDGNHEGTSITRDFLLLVELAKDEPGKKWDGKALFTASAESISTSHPAMFSLQSSTSGPSASVRHDSEKDWHILHLNANGKVGGKPQAIPLDFVVVGHAPE